MQISASDLPPFVTPGAIYLPVKANFMGCHRVSCDVMPPHLTRAITPTDFFARVQAINESLALADPSTFTKLATWVGFPVGFLAFLASMVLFVRELIPQILFIAIAAVAGLIFVGSIITIIVHQQRINRIFEQYVGGLMTQFCSDDSGRVAWRLLVWKTIKPVVSTHVHHHEHRHGNHTHHHDTTHQEVRWHQQTKRAIEIQVLI